jgi:hypothetical protein
MVFGFFNQTWPQKTVGKPLPGGGSGPSLPIHQLVEIIGLQMCHMFVMWLDADPWLHWVHEP